MTDWTADELARIGDSEELEIATARSDDSFRKPTTIWVVRLDDDVFVRSVNGPTSAWFRGAQDQHRARISAGGIERQVDLIDADHDLDDRIDSVYRTKYSQYAENILDAITSSKASSTTLGLTPRP